MKDAASLSVKDVLEAFETSLKGLSGEEAEKMVCQKRIGRIEAQLCS